MLTLSLGLLCWDRSNLTLNRSFYKTVYKLKLLFHILNKTSNVLAPVSACVLSPGKVTFFHASRHFVLLQNEGSCLGFKCPCGERVLQF